LTEKSAAEELLRIEFTTISISLSFRKRPVSYLRLLPQLAYGLQIIIVRAVLSAFLAKLNDL
jgi:hypothetical protein